MALIVVAALASFATYRYVKAGGRIPFEKNADKAQIEQLQQKIKTMQTRIDELQKGRRVSHTNHHVADTSRRLKTKSDSAKPSSATHTEVAPHPTEHPTAHRPSKPGAESTHHSIDPEAASNVHKPAPSAVKQPALGSQALVASPQQQRSAKELDLLKSNLAANNDQWQATADRLGNVVGQLDSQGNAIKKNQNNVNYLMALAHRTDIPFTLTRKRRFQRVGPISMKLAGTSVKGQRYDIRLIVDDKSVELKDRALNEVVQFYTSQSKFPLQLTVSRILKGEVIGTLAVPQDLMQQLSNTQLQEK